MHLFPLLVACGVGPAPTFDESFAYDPSGGSLFDPPMAGCTEVDTWVSDDLVRGTLVYDEGGHLTSETWEAPDYFSLEEADWEAGCLTRYEGVEEVPEGTTTTGYFAECDRRGDPGEQSWTEDGAEELSGIERSVKDSNGWIKAEISSTLDLDEGGRSAHYQALTYLANFLSEDTGFVEWGGLPFRPSTSWTFDGERLLSRVYTICTAFGSEECLVWSEDHHTWDANGLLTPIPRVSAPGNVFS